MRPVSVSAKITKIENDSLKKYFKEISAFEKFTPDEETACAKRIELGDEDAIQEMVQRNLRFVVSIAKMSATKETPLGDLIDEGNIGLMKAAKRYRHDMGFKFISYAVWWIRKYINEYLVHHSRSIRIPANKVNTLINYKKKVSLLEQKYGRSVDVQEVINEYRSDFTDEEFKSMDLLSSFNMDSLDREISDKSDGEGGGTLGDLIIDESSYLPTDYMAVESDIKTEIVAILGSLKEKESKVLIDLFGLNGKKPKTLNEIGVEMNITREAVRLIKERTLKKIRVKIKGRGILFDH